MLSLYTYFRSSASYRVRIGLALKGLAYASKPVHLVRNGGEQHSPDFAALNPAQLVPVLQDGGVTVTQSLAILEYLEETHPTPALLPTSAADRAHVRAMAQLIACEIHPINNLRVLQHLEHELHLDAPARNAWYAHWVNEGFAALELMLQHSGGHCCHGDVPGMADCCLVPQVYNARRFQISLAPYPTIARIAAHCEALPAFMQAAPEAQADAA